MPELNVQVEGTFETDLTIDVREKADEEEVSEAITQKLNRKLPEGVSFTRTNTTIT